LAERDEEALDELLRALAHSERRRILSSCQGHWTAAGALAEGTALSLATVSEHLKVLRKTGLVVLRREGRFWLYRTDPGRLADAIRALSETTKE